MTFNNVPAFWLFLCLPVVAGLIVWRGRARARALRRIGHAELVRYLSSQVSPSRRFWKAVLWFSAVASLVVALARPVWGVEAEVVETQGVAVVVVLDVSRSMDAQDVAPSRLERAKLDLHSLFNEIEGSEVGLVLFAGHAFVQFPLTSDIQSAGVFLDAASTDAVTQQGTSIDGALRLAMESFDERRPAQSVILLVSDGENQPGEPDPLLAARIAAEKGITIHVLGYGNPDGAPIPIRDATGAVNYKTDKGNNVVLSRLNEPLLQSIARFTGGFYQRATGSGDEISNLVDEINAMEGGVLGNRVVTRPVERFGIFVLLTLLILSLEMLLPETRGRD